MLAIYKKELRQYFCSMVGFAFLAFFLAIVGIYTWAYNFAGGLGNFEETLGSLSFLFVLLVPILTMRLLAEENYQKTSQLLLTAPVSVVKIILAKYFAVLTLFLAGTLTISCYPLIIRFYGKDVQLSSAYSSIVGFFLLGAACIAVGMFISSLTESQAIAAVVTFVVLLLSFLMTNISGMLPADSLSQCVILSFLWAMLMILGQRVLKSVKIALVLGVLGEAAIWIVFAVKSSLYGSLATEIMNMLAISFRFDDFRYGILNYDSVVYYLTIAFLFAFLTVQIVKRVKSGAFNGIVSGLFIALVVGANLFFGKVNPSTDLSSGSLFTLTEDTKKMAGQLKQDVTIYYMVEDGQETEYINKVLKQYDKISGRIAMEKINPTDNPGFAGKQGVEGEVSSNDVIVVNHQTKASQHVSASEMLPVETDYATGQSEQFLDVEGQVTSAIQRVVSQDRKKAYVLARHGEYELGTTIADALDKMNMDMEELELATVEEVPKDCQLLIVNGPETDISKEEKERILKYLKAGNNAILNAGYTGEKTPNYYEVLSYYGVEAESGCVFEGAGNYMDSPSYIVPQISDGTGILQDIQGYIVFPFACGLSEKEESKRRDTLAITELLATSQDSYLKREPVANHLQKEKGDGNGPFSLGYSVQEKVGGKETNLIVFASSGAFTEEFAGLSQLEDASVFKKAVSALSKSEVKEVSIDRKSFSYSYISVPPSMQYLWAGALILVVPGGLLAAGFLIWFLRRQK